MQTGRSFFMVGCSLKSIIKIYAKILSFVCILWLIAAGWYCFTPYFSTIIRFLRIADQNIPRSIYYILCGRESFLKTIGVPIVLLPCTIFLFHWISKREKEEIKVPAFVPREDFKLRTEVADVKKNMRFKNRNKEE